MKAKRLLSVIATAALAAAPAFAADYYVAANGKDSNPGTQAEPFGSPEMALMCAAPGETTTIHFQKDATFKIGTLRIEDGRNVILLGENTTFKASDMAPLDGGEGNRILRIGKCDKVEISGINFVNGRQVGYFAGGGIFHLGKELIVDNCSFIDCQAGSAGGGIASRGHYVKVTNSYFDGCHILGGGGVGGAISMVGNIEAEKTGELVVENCGFYRNSVQIDGGHATVISIYDPCQDICYALTGKVSVINCAFSDNFNAQAYVPDVDITDNGDCELVFVNNTMINSEVGVGFYFQTAPIYMFNNFIFANRSAIDSQCSIADYERTAIVAANNVLIGGEKAVTDNIDDPMLSGNDNTLGTAATNALGSFGIASSLTRDGNIAYFATSPVSKLNNAGLHDSSNLSDKVNLIPATDCRGYIAEGKKTIGSYQFGGVPAGVEDVIVADDDTNAPALYYNLNGVRVDNPANGLYIERRGTKARKVLIK